ncbi:CTLH, C-terminal LisH motif-containing protein [Cynara cardunculus var. scolymus]|uniref:CTLH, C-terminal LisH motif-containing protein n=1 Tax=Cynara cardunculus var. scolymus TaxID=59895 RepID=A0A103YBI2_CYNCS|nr:CTLH, C-terminal LisH motif-containing protein [Cynara cardunculus var. scolymus]
MSSLSRELVFLILQFLDEEKFKETVHKLEQESGFFFNMKYFEDEVHNGNWDEVEKYLSGFTKVDDNRYSMKIFFEIRKQKYLEALDKNDRSKAVEILVKDLKVFASFNEDLFKEITQLLTLENFRENEQLSKYGDTKSARAIMLVELKKLVEANPLFRDKLQFPNLKNSRPNPDIKTLFVDHSCGQPNGARAPSPGNNPLLGSLPKAGGFPPLGAHGPFQATPAPVPSPLAGWMSNPPAVSHPTVSGSAIGLGGPSIPVGTHVGDIGLWEVGSREKLVLKNFKVWNLGACSMPLQAALVKDPGVSVNRVIWSPDGSLFGVAYSRHIFIFSTALDGKIKAWLYDNLGSRVDYEAPGRWCTTMAYSADGTRLFSCGTSKDGESHIVEWNESEGAVKRTYMGFRKRSLGVVQFDTTKNRFLAAGDDFSVKYWDMDNVQLLTSVDADGGLPASPRIRFNKDGALLAVSANDNNIKILANSDGLRLLRTFENLSFDGAASRTPEAAKPAINAISAAAASTAALAERTMTTFMPPPPAATFLAFHPQDNNIIAIGMDDSTIQIYNVRVDEVKSKLKGHSKRITGLAFSHVLKVLVSSGADAQICVWSSDGWEKQKARYVQLPPGRTPTPQSDTRVQFHHDQIHFLVVHETQLAIYETTKLECVKQLIYASFFDATICVFTASHLRLCCRINPTANLNVHPLVIAAHPQEPNQFALGLSDGIVHVLEPLESDGRWGVPPPAENGSTSTVAATSLAAGSGSEQPTQR